MGCIISLYDNTKKDGINRFINIYFNSNFDYLVYTERDQNMVNLKKVIYWVFLNFYCLFNH